MFKDNGSKQNLSYVARASVRLLAATSALAAIVIFYARLSDELQQLHLFLQILIICTIIIIVILLVYFIYAAVRTSCLEIREIRHSVRKSNISQMPKNEKDIFSSSVLDPVGLSTAIHKRVDRLYNENDSAAEEVAIDFVWMQMNGLVLSNKGKKFQRAFLKGKKGGSYTNFMEFTKSVKENMGKPNSIYPQKLSQRNVIYGRFNSQKP